MAATPNGPAIQIDAEKFIKFCRKLQKELPTSDTFVEVLEKETLAVLKTTARKVKRATVANAGGKFNPRSRKFSGWVRMNGKFYWVKPSGNGNQGRKYSNSMWSKLQSQLEKHRKRAEARVGLSKAIFFKSARQLKLPRYSLGWDDSSQIKSALYDSGGIGSPADKGPIWPKHVSASKKMTGTNPKMQFTLSAQNTFNPFTKGQGQLERSFDNRIKYFENAVKKGLLKETKDIANLYPAINID